MDKVNFNLVVVVVTFLFLLPTPLLDGCSLEAYSEQYIGKIKEKLFSLRVTIRHIRYLLRIRTKGRTYTIVQEVIRLGSFAEGFDTRRKAVRYLPLPQRASRANVHRVRFSLSRGHK